MKKILSITLTVFIVVGFTVFIITHTNSIYGGRPKDYGKNRAQFIKYSDIHTMYFEKEMCFLKFRKRDSANYYRSLMHQATDSVNKYYTLMYPFGNPADQKDDQSNCNCK